MPLMNMLEKTLKWVAIIGVFCLPFVALIVSSSLFFPYITGKNFAFRIIVEIMAAAWLALAIVNPEYRPRRSWILATLALFVVVIGLADIFGVYPFKSIWSNFERMDGWITIAHLLAYTVVAASVMTSERLWANLFRVSLTVSGFLSVVGLLQAAGIFALGQGGAAGLTARIDATFGNPIYLAVYMLFHVFLAAILFVREWQGRAAGRSMIPLTFYGAVIALDTLALFMTGTRGTMLGLIGGAVLAALLYAFVSGSTRVRVYTASLVGIVVLAGLGLVTAKDTAFVQRVGFLQRLSTISLTDKTIASRFTNMSIAWQGVKERPVLGWGQENYAVVFDKYYDPRMHGNEPWFDRVHNVVFDWLVAGGFVGLLAYLSIFGAAVLVLWRSSAFAAYERSILTGLLAGYFFHNLTVFDNVTSYILFGTVLAYIAWRAGVASAAARVIERSLVLPRRLPYVAVLMAAVLWGTAWYVNADGLAQNRALLSAIMPRQNVLENLTQFEKALSYGAMGTQEAREQLAEGAMRIGGSNASVEVKQRFYDVATREMHAQMELVPQSARFPLFLGSVYESFGDLARAKTAYERAHENSPRKPTMYFALAANAYNRGDSAAALAYYREAHELVPENVDVRLYYAAFAIRIGETALARELLEPLTATQTADQRILAAYASRRDYASAAAIWAEAIDAEPTNTQLYFTLAALYYEAGDRARAISTLEAAKRAVPEVASQVDPLIEEIRSGRAQVQ